MCRGSFPAVLFLTGFCCLALVQPVLAAPEEGSGKRAELRQRALQKFDKNGNGQLDPDEREAARGAMQQRREQGGRNGAAGKGGAAPERRQKLLAKFDTDGDGKLSETEKAAAKEAQAKRGR